LKDFVVIDYFQASLNSCEIFHYWMITLNIQELRLNNVIEQNNVYIRSITVVW